MHKPPDRIHCLYTTCEGFSLFMHKIFTQDDSLCRKTPYQNTSFLCTTLLFQLYMHNIFFQNYLYTKLSFKLLMHKLHSLSRLCRHIRKLNSLCTKLNSLCTCSRKPPLPKNVKRFRCVFTKYLHIVITHAEQFHIKILTSYTQHFHSKLSVHKTIV